MRDPENGRCRSPEAAWFVAPYIAPIHGKKQAVLDNRRRAAPLLQCQTSRVSMSQHAKSNLVLSGVTVLLLALSAAFYLDLWGHPSPLPAVPLVDPVFTNT